MERGDEPVMSGEYDTTRWLFADQLGPHFDDGGPLLLMRRAQCSSAGSTTGKRPI